MFKMGNSPNWHENDKMRQNDNFGKKVRNSTASNTVNFGKGGILTQKMAQKSIF